MSEKLNEDRQREFCEYVAQGLNAYRAAIKAGYSEKYAKTDSHKLLEKYENKIKALKPIVQETLEKEFTYSVKSLLINFVKYKSLLCCKTKMAIIPTWVLLLKLKN